MKYLTDAEILRRGWFEVIAVALSGGVTGYVVDYVFGTIPACIIMGVSFSALFGFCAFFNWRAIVTQERAALRKAEAERVSYVWDDLKPMPTRYEITVDKHTTLYGSLTDADLTYIRRKYGEARDPARQRPSERNYPRLGKATWNELERLGMVYYPGARGAGRQWTDVGRKAIPLPH